MSSIINLTRAPHDREGHVTHVTEPFLDSFCFSSLKGLLQHFPQHKPSKLLDEVGDANNLHLLDHKTRCPNGLVFTGFRLFHHVCLSWTVQGTKSLEPLVSSEKNDVIVEKTMEFQSNLMEGFRGLSSFSP